MNAEKVEKLFWLLVIAWCILRIVLMSSQFLGNADPALRESVLQYFSEADISAGREYAMYGFWFRAVYGFLLIGALIAMLRYGFFESLWLRSGAVAGPGLLRQDLHFILTSLLLIQLMSLPSSIYLGYWREAESGFANIGFAGWLLRYFKSVLLGLGLQTVAILILLAVIRWFPQKWPILVPGVMGAFSLAVTLLAPVLITPLFYNQTLLEDGKFKADILGMAEQAGMEVDEVYVIDESRYSKHTNAYFTGVGRHRRIVLYDNLIKSHTPDEAALIFAHEAGHWKYSHVAWGLSIGVLAMLVIALTYRAVFPILAEVSWFGLKDIAGASGLPFLMVLFMLLQLFVAPVESQISQFMERQADRVALELTGLRDVFISAQVRLSRDNRSDLLPSPLRVFWLYSHPPAIERIRMAEEFKSR
ncbi:MAG: M48 family metallopeptidase [Candidatus Riflebacteria bacterium]|nr:M48 family metallopeptidase [Candidatus Riflebacteria bacterium]